MNLKRRIQAIWSSNPDFMIQIGVIVLTLMNNNNSMNRNITSVTTTIDTIRNVTEVISGTMQSLKVAAEAPTSIRQLLRKKQQ